MGAFTYQEYEKIIKTFKSTGYSFCNFNDYNTTKLGVVIRHDIDLDLNYALELAKLEKKLGIKSTYFVMISTESYNIFSEKNRKNINNILELEHNISLHFDCSIYKSRCDLISGCEYEISILENLIQQPINIISLHKPDKSFINNPDNLFNVEHTYLPKYMNDLCYKADSRGRWDYGHPLSSEYFGIKSFHICMHPIWWNKEEKTSVRKVIDCLKNKEFDLIDYLGDNLGVY